MAIEIKTEILINGESKSVWEHLTNYDSYPQWNPFIKRLEGNVEVGKKITVEIQPPNSKPMVFTPKIIEYKKNQQLTWLGHFILPGIFDGKHSFKLINNEDGTCTFVHSEQFTGILVPIFKLKLLNNTLQGFKALNEKLKELVESTI